MSPKNPNGFLGGGFFNIFGIFNLIPVEMIQFDEHIFQRGWRKTTKLDFSISKVEGKVEGFDRGPGASHCFFQTIHPFAWQDGMTNLMT